MQSIFLQFQEQLKNVDISFDQSRTKELIRNLLYINVSEKLNPNQNQILFQNIKKSKTIFINSGNIDDDERTNFFILVFYNTVIFIEQDSLHLLHELLSFNCNIKIYFINRQKVKQLFDKSIIFHYEEAGYNIKIDEYDKFIHLYTYERKIYFIWKLIQPCICLSLFKEGFCILKKNRIKNFLKKHTQKPITFSDNYLECIELGNIGSGSIFWVNLAYYFDKKEFFAIKKINSGDREAPKLFEREVYNYECLHHPFIPHFYGKSSHNLYIEFIDGRNLFNGNLSLNFDEKISIIFKLMIIIEFIHRNHFLIRVLNLCDIIVDENMNVVLVDFDRVIKYDSYKIKNEYHTCDFALESCAPEIFTQSFSYECDIYSLGYIIKHIMNKIPNKNSFLNHKKCKYPEITEIIEKCTEIDPTKRPSINTLIEYFYYKYHSKIILDIDELLKVYEECFCDLYDVNKIRSIQKKIDEINKNPELSFKKFMKKRNENSLYNSDKEKNDLNHINYQIDSNKQSQPALIYPDQNKTRKAIDLSSEKQKNNAETQSNLDIHNVIYYYELAALQNNAEAQFNLGLIYYQNIYIERDISKSIFYFSVAAEQNHVQSQLILAQIYYENKFVKQDIHNVIYYYELAALKNNSEAQFNLGLIYYQNIFVERDILKSIFYFSVAAEQNHVQSQLILAQIYYENKFVKQDIHNVIYYYKLAALQNNSEAQFNLGLICFEGRFVKRDLINARKFFSLAANQNHQNAIFYINSFLFK